MQLAAVVPDMSRSAHQQHCKHDDILISSGQQEQALSKLPIV
jgi:hypothetical protein